MIILSDEHDDIATPTGPMRVHLVRPAGAGRHPAVLFFSEIYQVTPPIRRLAALIAGHGFLVGIPEVYHEYEPAGTALDYDVAGTGRGNALKFAKPVSAFDGDAHAALDYLAGHPASTARLATFGVCLGGHLAFRAALNPSVSAAVCFYATDIHSGSLGEGRADDSLARMAELAAETLFVWGRQDPHVPFEGRERIRARLEEVGAPYQWIEVNAAHAFLRDEGPRYDPALLVQAVGWTVGHFDRTLHGAQIRSAELMTVGPAQPRGKDRDELASIYATTPANLTSDRYRREHALTRLTGMTASEMVEDALRGYVPPGVPANTGKPIRRGALLVLHPPAGRSASLDTPAETMD